jgi:hypothetical protein
MSTLMYFRVNVNVKICDDDDGLWLIDAVYIYIYNIYIYITVLLDLYGSCVDLYRHILYQLILFVQIILEKLYKLS